MAKPEKNTRDDKLNRLNDILDKGLQKRLRIYKYTTIASICTLGVVSYLYYEAQTISYASSEFMEVHAISVPNHTVGNDPQITYHRTVKRGFRGSWTVDLRHAVSRLRVDHCRTGSGVDSYETGDRYLPMSMRFFAGWSAPGDCVIPEGCYFVQATWHILDVPTHYIPPIVKDSNDFCVANLK